MTHVVLLCFECSCAGLFITQEVQPETMDDIDDLLASVVDALVGLFGGRVCANVEALTAERHFLTVDFVDGIVFFDEFVSVRDDLIISNNILGVRNMSATLMG